MTPMPSTSMMAPCPFCSPTSTAVNWLSFPVRWVWTKLYPPLAGCYCPGPHGNLLSANYTEKKVDAVLSPYDGLSIGILSALKGVGYCTKDLACPVVTGQDAEVASVKSMIAGEQSFTVFKDTRVLAKQTAKMVDQALKGEKVEINDTKTYDNGVKVVPSFLCIPQSVDVTNYKELLVDSGYIKAEDLK